MKKRKILSVISIRLIIAVGTACVLSLVGLFLVLSNRVKKDALDQVTNTLIDMTWEFYSKTDAKIVSQLDYSYGSLIPSVDQIDWDAVTDIWKKLDTIERDDELSVIRNDGRVMASTVDEVCGENVLTDDLERYKAASDLLKYILDDEKKYDNKLPGEYFFWKASSTEPQLSLDGKRKRRYYGVSLEDFSGIFIQEASDYSYLKFLNYVVSEEMYYKQIGFEGYTLSFSDIDGMRVAGGSVMGEEGYPEEGDDFTYPELASEWDNSRQFTNISIDEQNDEEASIPVYYVNGQKELYGKASFYAVTKVGNYYIMVVYPKDKAEHSMYSILTITFLMELLIFVLLYIVILIIEKKIIINNIYRINNTLSLITQGNLEEKVDVCDNYEFDALSKDINSMVDRLKGYIAEAAARIDADLEIAKEIQTSVLPNTFPPFPDWHQFELFASMQAAKEVGGDFYDFYMIGMDTLGFLIADVSGKSIPGAMFMMTGKAIIKNLAESGMPPADTFSIANEKLCEGNEAELFITAWMGYLDLKTGEVHVANAGHNPPVLIRDGKAEYVILKPGLMLAGMEGTIYKEQTLQLKKGDILYLYTDGVTEAMDADENQYGEDRLIELLSFGDDYPAPAGDNGIAGAVCELVTKDIEAFVQGAEQSDDITMLCVRYMGK